MDAYSRLHPGSSVVFIGARYHHDDLAGRLLDEMENGGEAWDVVRFPAVFDDGTPLWPERFSAEEIERTKRAVVRAFGRVCTWASRPRIKVRSICGIGSSRAMKPGLRRTGGRGDSVLCGQRYRSHGGRRRLDRSLRLWRRPEGVASHRPPMARTSVGGRLDRQDDRDCRTVEADALDVWQRSRVQDGRACHPHRDADGWQIRAARHRTGTRRQNVALAILRRLDGERTRPLNQGAAWYAQAENELLKFPAGRTDDVADTMSLVGFTVDTLSRGRSEPPPPEPERY